MSQRTPEATFYKAQTAMLRGDWDGFFVCLDPDSLARIAENSVAYFLRGDDSNADVFARLCSEHGVPEESIVQLRTLLQRMGESARELTAHARSSEPEAMLRESLKHKQIVDEYQKVLSKMVKTATDLPRFTAGLERALRAAAGGGSVSSRLFFDEVLENVAIEGARAWATRRFVGGQSEEVGFARRKDLWYIRLFVRPGKRLE